MKPRRRNQQRAGTGHQNDERPRRHNRRGKRGGEQSTNSLPSPKRKQCLGIDPTFQTKTIAQVWWQGNNNGSRLRGSILPASGNSNAAHPVAAEDAARGDSRGRQHGDRVGRGTRKAPAPPCPTTVPLRDEATNGTTGAAHMHANTAGTGIVQHSAPLPTPSWFPAGRERTVHPANTGRRNPPLPRRRRRRCAAPVPSRVQTTGRWRRQRMAVQCQRRADQPAASMDTTGVRCPAATVCRAAWRGTRGKTSRMGTTEVWCPTTTVHRAAGQGTRRNASGRAIALQASQQREHVCLLWL